MRIAICEDKQEHTEILHRMIQCWAEQENIKVDIGCYKSAEQFLYCMEEDAHYDLAFLDIQLEKMNGLQLASLIRKEDKTIILIFTTGLKNYAPRGYEVSAFRYLLKPLKENEVVTALTEANKKISDIKKDAIVVIYNNETRRIYKNDIYFIEVDNHYIMLHLKEEIIRFKAKLKDFESQFKEPQFCKCHRSYIVNLRHAGKITKNGIEIDNGRTLPISRTRWNELNHCYLMYYIGK